MKLHLLMALILLPLAAMSQSKYKLQGQIEIYSVSRGGAQIPDDYFKPVPFQTTIYVVKFVNDQTIPVIVDTIVSAKDGSFEIELLSGKYGVVSSADLSNLKPGQFLPASTSSYSSHMYYSTSWQSSITMPIDLTTSDVSGITLTYNSQSSCMDCP